MMPGKNDDRQLPNKRISAGFQGTAGWNEPAPSASGKTSQFGRWIDGQFKFSSPAAESEWHRHAYRQAVHPDDWHKGNPVDPQIVELAEAGAGGKIPPYFTGPDGQRRFSNFQTIEPAEVRAIRARNFDGKSLEQISAAKMPGEDEAVRHLAAAKGRTRSGARPDPANAEPKPDTTQAAVLPRESEATHSWTKGVIGADSAPGKQSSKQDRPILLADASGMPVLPEGYGTAAPKPMGGVDPWNADGKVPGSNPPDIKATPANDNMKPGSAPNANGPRVRDRQSTFSPTAPAGSIPTPSLAAQSPLHQRKSEIDQAVQAAIGKDHERWAQDAMADPHANDPAAIAEKANRLIAFDLPYVIDTYRNLPQRDVYQTLTPLDIELLRGGYTQQIVDLFPEQFRPQLQKELDARPKFLTSGPAGLSDVLQAMQQGEVTGFEINGEPMAPETMMSNPHGTLGSPPIQDFNRIVKEEAEKLLEACKDPGTDIEHVAGAGKTESWIQDFLNPWMQRGGRRIDVTLKFKINGQDCSFQINTADTAIKRLFTKREWDAINASADMMRENGANSDVINGYWAEKLGGKLGWQLNAFFMVPKPGRDKRTLEEMRKLARDTLGVLSCSEIELACRGNLVINKDPTASMR